jgi:formylglycine-generating enzyme required for sulfatase activity
MLNKSTLAVILFVGLAIGGCSGGAETVTATPSPTPESDSSLPSGITDARGVEMVLVPAGEFEMGSAHGDHDEKPVHPVYLNAYYIDKYQATNAQYRGCVEAGVCQPPKSVDSYSRPGYFEDPEFADFPVVHVDWNMAQTFCGWREVRLPTEAEWEKAARGTGGRTYPWGEGIDCQRANYYRQEGTIFFACVGDTTRVGSYEDGVSPYGVHDMTGNVWEWVADWYAERYYAVSPESNPTGPDAGREKVIRGGSWFFSDYSSRAANRYWFNPVNAYDNIGFRCAVDATP